MGYANRNPQARYMLIKALLVLQTVTVINTSILQNAIYVLLFKQNLSTSQVYTKQNVNSLCILANIVTHVLPNKYC